MVLTTAEMSEAFLLADSRVLAAPMAQAGSTAAVVSMVEAAPMAVVVDTGECVYTFNGILRNFKNERNYHAAQYFDCWSHRIEEV